MTFSGTMVFGNKTFTQIKINARKNLALYSVRTKNHSSHPTFEVIMLVGSQIPTHYGVHRAGFTHLYDAERRFHDWDGKPELNPFKKMTVGPPPSPIIRVDAHRRGGSNAGS